MNRVELIGELILPVEVRRDQATGQTVGRADVVVPNDVDEPAFVSCVLWGREASDAARYLGEGSRLAVWGRLRSLVLTQGARRRRMVYVDVERLTYLTVCPPRDGGCP